jgi:hypothetical protein
MREQVVREDTVTESGRGIAGAAGIIALGNVVSRILGLVRVTVIADLFGATGLVSAYQIAATVPTMIYDLLIGGMLSSALVPVFSEYAAKTKQELWRIVNVVLSSHCLNPWLALRWHLYGKRPSGKKNLGFCRYPPFWYN